MHFPKDPQQTNTQSSITTTSNEQVSNENSSTSVQINVKNRGRDDEDKNGEEKKQNLSNPSSDEPSRGHSNNFTVLVIRHCEPIILATLNFQNADSSPTLDDIRKRYSGRNLNSKILHIYSSDGKTRFREETQDKWMNYVKHKFNILVSVTLQNDVCCNVPFLLVLICLFLSKVFPEHRILFWSGFVAYETVKAYTLHWKDVLEFFKRANDFSIELHNKDTGTNHLAWDKVLNTSHITRGTGVQVVCSQNDFISKQNCPCLTDWNGDQNR